MVQGYRYSATRGSRSTSERHSELPRGLVHIMASSSSRLGWIAECVSIASHWMEMSAEAGLAITDATKMKDLLDAEQEIDSVHALRTFREIMDIKPLPPWIQRSLENAILQVIAAKYAGDVTEMHIFELSVQYAFGMAQLELNVSTLEQMKLFFRNRPRLYHGGTDGSHWPLNLYL